MNEIEYAITNFEEFLEADIGQGDLHMCSAEIALAALRAEQERMSGCDYCREYTINSVTVGSTFLGLCSDGRVKINTTDTIKSPRFCPNCGRRLTEGSAE